MAVLVHDGPAAARAISAEPHVSRLLAPVSAAVEVPTSLLLVYLTGFDLVHTSGTAEVRIGEHVVDTGHLPLEGLHHRRLIKVSDGLTVVHMNRAVTFRQWPTSYRWRADVDLGQGTMCSAWSRTGCDRGQGYRQATGSGG